MAPVTLTVNGRRLRAELPARLHLADFLREHQQLTGTHLGCEHGVCGACTILLEGEPARACITYVAACEGADIRTIEGLEQDPVAIRLRAAFTAHHGLQCGYCTPGMMVTARDIVRRLPDATDDDIRLELAGNLCRCTGYNGIVRAIRQVLDERLPIAPMPLAALPAARFGDAAPALVAPPPAAPGQGLRQRLRFAVAPEVLWAMLRDPAAIVSCVPGASLTDTQADVVSGAMAVSLGPVRARFAGTATLTYDDAARSGVARGGGQDQSSGTRLTAAAEFRVLAEAGGAVLLVEISYTLRGALAQLAKPRVVALLADEIAGMFAATLAARLEGRAPPAAAPLPAFRLLLRMVLAWLRGRG